MELKKDIKSELEKIKQMSVKDRIWYIYEYYKFHIVAVILAFTLLWVVGSSLYRQTFTTRLTFAIVNDRSGGESSMDGFENSLKEALGFGKKDLIEINSGLFINADGSPVFRIFLCKYGKDCCFSSRRRPGYYHR